MSVPLGMLCVILSVIFSTLDLLNPATAADDWNDQNSVTSNTIYIIPNCDPATREFNQKKKYIHIEERMNGQCIRYLLSPDAEVLHIYNSDNKTLTVMERDSKFQIKKNVILLQEAMIQSGLPGNIIRGLIISKDEMKEANDLMNNLIRHLRIPKLEL